MLILNGGVPRSGTTWVFNIIRTIFNIEGTEIATTDGHTPDRLKAAIDSYDGKHPLLVHYHDILEPIESIATQPFVRSFYSYRDPRDVVVSMRGLHDCTFDEAIGMVAMCFKYVAAAAHIHDNMFIPYEYLYSSPRPIVLEIGQRLGYLLKLSDVERIIDDTAAQNWEPIIQKLNHSKSVGGTLTVDTGIRVIRYDEQTMINDRHIQSGELGRWRSELTKAQQVKANEAFAYVIGGLGYARD
ncbi:MAG: sulfotransferase domain-containing protein [Gammaproteobacteria bacterium]|nr:sulfotransferase domain-containing protein [Gammaproteobacteria bacterium]